ncbi:MAG: hypothetical protein V2J55_04515 [Candidatus Competibacteraceae bacterium]|jgi:hypothetical protein|nr:hypothetical protein [Candidatus Competibacteraceae bacterium]
MLINAHRYTFKLNSGEVITWPKRTVIELFHRQPTLGLVRFHDMDLYHPSLSDQVLQRAADSKRKIKGGPSQIDELHAWNTPEAELISTRALKLCSDLMHSERCRIVSAYAMIFGETDYLPPQKPEQATASVVYVLEPGDADPAGSNGRLCFTRPGTNQTVQAPERVTAGTFLAHPADMQLAALPYTGQHPRVLLIWHIVRE